MTTLFESAKIELQQWNPGGDADESLRHTMLAFLDTAGPSGCLRSHVPGHITASALVADADLEHVLLTLHPRVGRWIQLGGHCEPGDATVRDAALREAREESGLPDLTIEPGLIGAHTHPITCSLGEPTRHLDLRFLVLAPSALPPIRSQESIDLQWWPVNDLPPEAESATIDALIKAARQRR